MAVGTHSSQNFHELCELMNEHFRRLSLAGRRPEADLATILTFLFIQIQLSQSRDFVFLVETYFQLTLGIQVLLG